MAGSVSGAGALTPMHIVTAAHDFYPDPGSGGTGRYVYETARRLVDRGHEVSVVTRRRGDVPRWEVVEGVSVSRYDVDISDRSAPEILPQLPRACAAVRRQVDALESPDLLSAQGPVTSLLVDRALGEVPCVATFHSPWPTEYRIRTREERTAPRRWLNAAARWAVERQFMADADRVVTLSEFMRGLFRRRYRLDVETAVVPGGVDARRYAPAAGPCERVTAGEPAFLTVRRLAERMGHELLLEAFASVVDVHPSAHLYVAGDGPLGERLERTAASLGVAEETTFLGYVPDEELPAVYAAADVFVLPTVELEGFGLATLEALASGTPAVGTAVGGTVEVLGDLAEDPAVPEPVLVEPVDADALADRMAAWAALPAAALARAGRACRRYARERYPWERTAAALEREYAAVLD